MDMLDQLSLAGLVPVIKIENAEDAVPLCRALSNGGLPVAEITFRSDAAEQSIRNVHAALPEVMLGAGTVLTTEQVDRAIDAGATYIVSPGFNPTVVAHCQERGIAVLPGCANPSDIEMALSMGVETVKFFPAEALGGLPLVKAMAAPYGKVQFVPTGGISEKNFLEYLAFPKIRAVGGSWMVPDDAIKAKDWAKIEQLTKTAVTKLLGFELLHVAINSGNPEQAAKDAAAFSKLLGWPCRELKDATMVGQGIEVMKIPLRGEHGHLSIGANDVRRARWHLERQGFAFDDASATVVNGKTIYLFLKEDIAGFSLHLEQK